MQPWLSVPHFPPHSDTYDIIKPILLLKSENILIWRVVWREAVPVTRPVSQIWARTEMASLNPPRDCLINPSPWPKCRFLE